MRRWLRRRRERVARRIKTRWVAGVKVMKSRREVLLVTVLFIGGLLAIAFGFGLMYTPLGFVVGGLLSAIFSGLWATRAESGAQ